MMPWILSHWRAVAALAMAMVLLGTVEYWKHRAHAAEDLYEKTVIAGRVQEAQARAEVSRAKVDKLEADDAHTKAVSDLAIVYSDAFKRVQNSGTRGRIVPAVPGTACLGEGSGSSARREALAAGMADAGRRLQQSLDRNDQFLQQGALRITRRGDKYAIDLKTCAQWAMKEYSHASQIRSPAP